MPRSKSSRDGRKPKVHRDSPSRRNGRAGRITGPTTISQYLIRRLHEVGIGTVFGIPGDYVLGFYDELSKSPIQVVGTTREEAAGFAADAYARIHGMGAVCVTYCVGGLNVVNAVAGAYAEKSPLLVISGSPGLNEREHNPLLHHKVRDFNTQRDIFEKITVASAVLDDAYTAFREIERVLEAVMRFKRPGYLEIPRDCTQLTAMYDPPAPAPAPTSDAKNLAEAVEEAAGMLQQSQRPVLLVGVEVHRFGLEDLVMQFADRHKIPFCSTLLGKSAVSESHPLFVGLYEGALGREGPRRFVEESDCILLVGAPMTDIDMGIFTARLDPGRCISATSEELRIRHHYFHDVLLADFVSALARKKISCGRRVPPARDDSRMRPFRPKADEPVTIRRLFEKINGILTEEMVVICDVGDALFAGADLSMHRRTEFLSPAYYTSMGFAIPATLGVLCADPNARPIAIVGDGAFQMTGMELSTIDRLGFAPIVIVLNNQGYTTERYIKDGPYNDIGNWNYHRVTEVLGGGWGFEVRTETDLEKALNAALANRDSFSLLNVHLDKWDRSEAMERLATRLAARLDRTNGR